MHVELTRKRLPGADGGARAPFRQGAIAAIADQALFAGSQLVVNLLLARWLEPEAYGAFALAYALFLVVAALHTAFLADPLLVFVRTNFASCLPTYCGAILGGHVLLALALGAALGLTGAILWVHALGSGATVLAFAVTSPVFLTLILVRRVCYALGLPLLALSGSAISASATLGAVVALRMMGTLSGSTAIAALALGAGGAAAWIVYRVEPRPALPDRAFLHRVAAKHWCYGRWAALGGLANWAPWNLHFVLLAGFMTLEDVGAARALYNVALPAIHLMTPLNLLSLPVLAGQLASTQPLKARSTALALAALYAGAGATYLLTMVRFGPELLAWLYGDAYQRVYALAPYVAALPIPLGGMMIAALMHRAAARADRALVSWLSYVGLSLVLGAGGAALFGVTGLVLGILVSAWVGCAAALVLLSRWAPWCCGDATPSAPARSRFPGSSPGESRGSDRYQARAREERAAP